MDIIHFRQLKKAVYIIFIIAFASRLLYAIISYHNQVYLKFADDNGYFNYALDIIEQGPWVPDVENLRDNRSNYLAPGLPLILSLPIIIFGKTWLPIFIINALLSALLSVLIFIISNLLFDKRIALISASWSIIYISYIRYVPTGGKELWITLLLLITVLFLIKLLSYYNIKYLLVIILAFSLLIHIDERYFAYFPLFCVLFFLINNQSIRKKILISSIYVIGVFLIMIPWTIRNYKVYHKPVILTQRTSHITDKFFGLEEDFYFETMFLENNSLTEAQIDSVIKGQKTTFANGKKIPEKQINAMRNGNLPHHFSQSEALKSRFLLLWSPCRFGGFWAMEGFSFVEYSLRHNLAMCLVYGTLLPFLLIGFLFLFKKNWKFGILLLSILIWHTLIHIIFIPYTNERYQVPVSPYIIIIGTAGIFLCFNYLYKRTYLLLRKNNTLEKNHLNNLA